eukprot:5980721-Pyramimonas_sp.AAC.1
MLQRNVHDDSASITWRTSYVALLQFELSTENREHLTTNFVEYQQLRGPSSSSRPSSDLKLQQTNASDDSGSIMWAHQLCSTSTAR